MSLGLFVCVCVCCKVRPGEPWSTQGPAAPADGGRVLPACKRVCPVAAANPQPAGCNHHSRQAVCYCGATRPILRVEAWLRESRSRFATLQAHARRRAARRRLPAKAKPGRGARAGGTQAAQPRPVDCGSKRSNPSRIQVMVLRGPSIAVQKKSRSADRAVAENKDVGSRAQRRPGALLTCSRPRARERRRPGPNSGPAEVRGGLGGLGVSRHQARRCQARQALDRESGSCPGVGRDCRCDMEDEGADAVQLLANLARRLSSENVRHFVVLKAVPI